MIANEIDCVKMYKYPSKHKINNHINCNNVEDSSAAEIDLIRSDSSTELIDSFKTARKLLKKPVDYTNLNEVHSRCKIIMEKLGNTLQAFEHVENSKIGNNEDSSSEKKNMDKMVGIKKNKQKRKHNLIEESRDSSELVVKKTIEPVFTSPFLKKKKRAFKPFKDTVELIGNPAKSLDIVSSEEMKDINVDMEAINIIDPPVQQNKSCDTLATAFSSLTASNTWELLQLRRMLEDPFLSTTRKQYLHSRILELNNNIIQDLLKQAERSDRSEFFVLEKLSTMTKDESLLPEQKQQVDCVFTSFKEKVVSGVMTDVSDSVTNYDQTIDKLHALLRMDCITVEEKGKFLNRVMELRAKMASSLSKQTHVPLEDGVRLLERIRHVMNDPFLPQDSKSKLMHKVKYLRNQTVSKLMSQPIAENDNDLISKLNAMLQDPCLQYHKRLAVVNKIKTFEEKASLELKRNKLELKEKLMTSVDEILSFDGTNLDFIVGYGVNNPQYVRCIHIWNPQKL